MDKPFRLVVKFDGHDHEVTRVSFGHASRDIDDTPKVEVLVEVNGEVKNIIKIDPATGATSILKVEQVEFN